MKKNLCSTTTVKLREVRQHRGKRPPRAPTMPDWGNLGRAWLLQTYGSMGDPITDWDSYLSARKLLQELRS